MEKHGSLSVIEYTHIRNDIFLDRRDVRRYGHECRLNNEMIIAQASKYITGIKMLAAYELPVDVVLSDAPYECLPDRLIVFI